MFLLSTEERVKSSSKMNLYTLPAGIERGGVKFITKPVPTGMGGLGRVLVIT